MGIFSTPPKRVNKKELEGTAFHSGVYGAMKNGEDRLKPEKFKVFKAIVDGSMDSERHKGQDWSGITAKEIPELKKQLEDSGHFNERQITKAIKQFEEKL